MLKEKIKNVKVAQVKVRDLRRQVRTARRNFACIKESSNVIVDNFSDGAHTHTTLDKCPGFGTGRLCDKPNCKSFDWLKNYILLSKNLDDARVARNDLLVKYFWICRKYREYKDYKKLDDLAKLRNREYLHRVCESLYLYDSEDEDIRVEHKQTIKAAEDAYIAILEQRNAARAKFLGRNK